MLGLNLASPKIIFVHFNQRNNKPGTFEIKINDTVIKSSEIVRFLGITFDYRHSFEHQVNQVQKKYLLANKIIKFLRGTWWGSSPNTLLILYKSYVRSIIDYGSFVYYPTTIQLKTKLETIQHNTIRNALGFRNSTPTNVLIAESKLQPIEERVKYLCLWYLSKIYSNKNLLSHSTFINFQKILTNNPKKSKKKTAKI